MTDDERLTELEIRYTLQQDFLLQLSDVIARQEQDLQRLRTDLTDLRSRLPTGAGEEYDPDEKPPHY